MTQQQQKVDSEILSQIVGSKRRYKNKRPQNLEDFRERLDKESGHVCLVILGPRNLPYVKFFVRSDPAATLHTYAHYNHCQVICHNAIWLSCADAGKRACSSIKSLVSQRYNEVSAEHFEMNYDEFEMELLLDRAFQFAGITWSKSDQDREKWLDEEAGKLYQNALARKRAEMGVIVDG